MFPPTVPESFVDRSHRRRRRLLPCGVALNPCRRPTSMVVVLVVAVWMVLGGSFLLLVLVVAVVLVVVRLIGCYDPRG